MGKCSGTRTQMLMTMLGRLNVNVVDRRCWTYLGKLREEMFQVFTVYGLD